MLPRRSLVAQIQEVERELELRRRVYPRQVAAGKMRKGEADEHILRLECVGRTLHWLAAHEASIKAAIAAESGSE